jgi:hypothetical protein
MAKIIEITTPDDKKVLVNTRRIEQIEGTDSGTAIYFAFNIPNAYEQDYLYTKESYEEVKMKVWGCNGE